MATATHTGPGDYDFPGAGNFRPGETKSVPVETAARLRRYPDEFSVAVAEDETVLRGEAGNIRYLGYFGPVDSRFGYGGAGITILRALTALGIEASVNAAYNLALTAEHREPHLVDLPADARQQLEFRSWFPQTALAHCLPDDLVRCDAPRRIAWTMWESDKIPDGSLTDFGDWTALLNNNADQLVVPCQENAEVFRTCGVALPITVLPYGLDDELWPYVERPERDTFTVVQFGDLSSRKGVAEGIAAFQRAFPIEQNVRLVLKTQAGRFAGRFGVPSFSDSRIVAIDQTWTRGQLANFLHSADCFLWLSRGEGFGLPPLQAALTGLPVITTTHTGMGAYYDKRYFYGVQARKAPSPMGGSWYDPDVDDAAAKLREVYERRSAALKKGKAAAAYARKNFSLAAFTGRLSAFIDTL